jgi:NADPH:quinone reductase-like Zn-dependent oxidoreductase
LGRRNRIILAELAAQGVMRPLVSRSFPLSAAREALSLLEVRAAIGRIVLEP